MTDLTSFERAVLSELLAINTVPNSIRSQLSHVRVSRREESGVGVFVHLFVPPEVIHEGVEGFNQQLGGVFVDIPGLRYGLGFVLFVTNGVLDMLEGYTFGDEKWPAEISKFSLHSVRVIGRPGSM